MPNTPKPKLAFFDFASCEGCQIEFTNYGDEATLELLNHVEIVEFREAMTETTTGAHRHRLGRRQLHARGGPRATPGHPPPGESGRRLRRLRLHRRHQRPEEPPGRLPRGGLRRRRRHASSAERHRSAHLGGHQGRLRGHGLPDEQGRAAQRALQPAPRHPRTRHPPIPSACSASVARRSAATTRATTAWARSREPDAARRVPAQGIPCEACRGFVDDANLPALEKVLVERAGFSQKRAVSKSRMFTANLRS